MKKILLISSSLIILLIFSSFLNLFGSSLSAGSKMGHKITYQIGKKLEAKYGVDYLGLSEVGPNGKYEIIGLELNYNKILSRDEGRILLLNCVKDVLDGFNSYPKFRQHMDNYPFTGNNIIVNIFIHPPHLSRVYYPEIAVFSFYDNKLEFKTNSPENRFKYYTTEEESYDEALRIADSQRSGN